MELTYLWVEDFKNINDASINLSFHYNVKTDVNIPNRKIRIDFTENEFYIDNFYGTTIENITGIIGENGSGKTNILEYIIQLLNGEYNNNSVIQIFKNRPDKTIHIYYLIYQEETVLTDYSDWEVVVSGNINGYKIIEPKVIPFNVRYNFLENYVRNKSQTLDEFDVVLRPIVNNIACIYFSPIYDNRYIEISGKYELEYFDISTNSLSVEDADGYEGIIDSTFWERHKYKNIERQLNFIVNNPSLDLNLPNKINVRFNKINFNYIDLNTNTNIFYKKTDKEFSGKIIEIRDKIPDNYKKGNQLEIELLYKEKIKLWFLRNLFNLFFLNISNTKFSYDNKKFETIIKNQNENEIDFTKKIIAFFETQNFINKNDLNIVNLIKDTYRIINELAIIDFDEDNEAFFDLKIDDAKYIMDIYNNFHNSFKKSFNKSFIDIGWRNLSSGEKLLLDFYSRLFEVSKKVRHNTKYIYLMIDEGETTMHPVWQRSYIDRIVKICNDFFINKKVQVILSSHSPILISDFPKGNLVLLQNKTDSSQKKQMIILNEEESIAKTLAANIHKIYTDSFFLNEGLIGEFIKNKINALIKSIDNKSLSENEIKLAYNFISLIDEPVIKELLYEKLFSKNKSLNNKYLIEREIKRLNSKLDDLK